MAKSARSTNMLRQEPLLRNEIYSRAQVVEQAKQNYRDALAEGLRTFEELVAFRKSTAAAVQDYRHQDMAFRIFRNDALQKYRAAFDLAARFTYLAATAYDYDTNLVGSSGNSGRQFLTDIVRQRSLGQILNAVPVPGSPGLADPLGRMAANFAVLKTQMGFNNPQIETNRFSLRTNLFRLDPDAAAAPDWRAELLRYRVDDLWDVPEFRRFARPFTEEALGKQPGLVIPFSTTVTFGLNFFGWPLAAGDSVPTTRRSSPPGCAASACGSTAAAICPCRSLPGSTWCRSAPTFCGPPPPATSPPANGRWSTS